MRSRLVSLGDVDEPQCGSSGSSRQAFERSALQQLDYSSQLTPLSTAELSTLRHYRRYHVVFARLLKTCCAVAAYAACSTSAPCPTYPARSPGSRSADASYPSYDGKLRRAILIPIKGANTSCRKRSTAVRFRVRGPLEITD